MANLVGVYAASHGPMIAREWDSLTPPTRASVEEGFGQVGKRLMASRPDILVIVSPDHWVNFFLNNFPAFCVGVGAEHDGPPEPFLKKHFHHLTLAGHPGLGNHIMNTANRSRF
jgi:aromatic ring-opening dioxygenase catalytic subunit (LigB family)